MFFRKMGGASFIIAFLGNPGAKYARTRHNAGFMAADAVEKSQGISIARLRFKALTARCDIGGESVLLMKPQTYMNLSGEAVSQAAAFYKIPPARVIAISDDTSLPAGKIRLRGGGSSGGQKGLQSLIDHLGTSEFPRIRIGVGAPPANGRDMVDWVISTLTEAELTEQRKNAARAAECALCAIKEGLNAAMSKYN